MDSVLDEVICKTPFFFCLEKTDRSHHLYLQIKHSKDASGSMDKFLNVKMSHFEKLKQQEIELENLLPYLSTDSLGSLFIDDLKLPPSVFKLLAKKNKLLTKEGAILFWKDEIPNIKIKILPTDTGWKVWAHIEWDVVSAHVSDLWDIGAFLKSSFLIYQNTLYALPVAQFSTSLLADYLFHQGSLSLEEREVGDFIVECFNQIGPLFFEVISLSVEMVKLRPLEILYLKTKEAGFNEISPIEGQLWFRYQNREMPALCHKSDRRWHMISSTISENKLYLYIPDEELEQQSTTILIKSDFCSYLSKRDVFVFDFFRLHETLSLLLEAGWEIWAENLKVKLLQAFQAVIKTSSVGFLMEFKNPTNSTLIETWQLILILKKKAAFIKLDDGSLGVLPQFWIKELYRLYEKANGEFLPHSSLLHFNNLINNQKLPISGDAQFEEQRAQLNDQKRMEVYPGSSFCGILYDYQKQGLNWLVFLNEYNLGGLLADEMGLGKTVQVLAFLNYLKSEEGMEDQGRSLTHNCATTLIVAPKSVVGQWQEDAHKFTPHLNVKIMGPQDFLEGHFDRNLNHDILIISYGLARRYIACLVKHCFERIILDEAQIIKNSYSKVNQAICSLVSKKRLALTGTPIENCFSDFFSIFNFLNPGFLNASLFSNEDQYSEEVIKQAFDEIKPLILRRKKIDVLKNFPKKEESTLFLPLLPEQEKFYEDVKHYYSNQLNLIKDENDFLSRKFFFIEGILRLRQVCCHPQLLMTDNETKNTIGTKKAYRLLNSSKMDYCLQEINKIVNGADKAIFFSQFTSFLKIIKEQLDIRGICYQYLDGQTEDRQKVVERFQVDPDIKIFLISLKAGGLGLNITAANSCFLLDPWWNPAIEEQAMNRIHRIGQTKDVQVYRRLSKNS